MAYTREEILAHREAWLKTLETTDMKQATGLLSKSLGVGIGDVGYCCLGVACELMTDIPKEHTRRFGDLVGVYGEDAEYQELPVEAQEYYDIPSRPRSGGVLLDELNDKLEYSFKDIASHIRKHGFDSDNPSKAVLANNELEKLRIIFSAMCDKMYV